MNNAMNDLFRISKNNAECAIEVLVKAFNDYPLFKYYFPDESIRGKISHYILSLVIYAGIRYGEVYAPSSNMEGIVVWIPSNNYPLTFWKIFRSVPLSKMLGIVRYGGAKMKSFNDYIENVHQRLVPFNHLFMQAIGIAPKFQSRGYASKLIKPMLNKIDNEHIPCYLETLSEKNVSVYEHFGFETIDKSSIPETSFMNWAMLRKPQ